MSVRAYTQRRKAYKFGPVSNPGHPSPTNRAERRRKQFVKEVEGCGCDCGNCIAGQDKTCPAGRDTTDEDD